MSNVTESLGHEFFWSRIGRIVEGYNLKKIVTSNLPNNSFMKVLIYSRYFDERVNDERTAFSFSKTENNPSIANPIPFTEISAKIEEILDGIVLNRFPSILEDNDRVIQECLSEKPYLSKYIFQDESLIMTKNQRGIVRKIKEFISFLDTNCEFVTEYISVGDGIAISRRK